MLQGVTVLANHKQVFWFKAGSCAAWRHQSNSLLTEYSRDKGPFLAVFDQLPLRGSAVMSITENSDSPGNDHQQFLARHVMSGVLQPVYKVLGRKKSIWEQFKQAVARAKAD